MEGYSEEHVLHVAGQAAARERARIRRALKEAVDAIQVGHGCSCSCCGWWVTAMEKRDDELQAEIARLRAEVASYVEAAQNANNMCAQAHDEAAVLQKQLKTASELIREAADPDETEVPIGLGNVLLERGRPLHDRLLTFLASTTAGEANVPSRDDWAVPGVGLTSGDLKPVPHPTNIADAVSCLDCGGPTRPIGNGLYECLTKTCNEGVEPQEGDKLDPAQSQWTCGICKYTQYVGTPCSCGYNPQPDPEPLAQVLARLEALEKRVQSLDDWSHPFIGKFLELQDRVTSLEKAAALRWGDYAGKLRQCPAVSDIPGHAGARCAGVNGHDGWHWNGGAAWRLKASPESGAEG